MTANSKASREFKAVAREAAQLGARFVGATREWFDDRRQETSRTPGGGHRATPGGPADDDERTYGRDEHAAGDAGARRSGYRGIGPRGYTRSDARIREDVCEGLCDSDDIDAADINVDVGSGTVRLSGTVPNRAMKHRAEDIAETCSGVRDIENSIRVAGVDPVGGFGVPTDASASTPGTVPGTGASSTTGSATGVGLGSGTGASGLGTGTGAGSGLGSANNPNQAR